MMSASERFSNDGDVCEPCSLHVALSMLAVMASSCSMACTCASESALETLSSPGVPFRSLCRQGSRGRCDVCPSHMLSGQMGYGLISVTDVNTVFMS